MKNCAELGVSMRRIVKRLLANQNLCKLLSNTGKDPLGAADISNTDLLFEKNIKIIPKMTPLEKDNNVLILSVKRGALDPQNQAFRSINLVIGVYVPLSQWTIKDDNLRPFAIIGEIQKSLSGKEVNGLGKIIIGNFELSLLTEEMSRFDVEVIITVFD